MPIDGGADVTDSGRARYHLLGDFARPINLAQRPQDQAPSRPLWKRRGPGQNERQGRYRARGSKIASARSSETRAICKISSEPVRGTVKASSDASFWRSWPGLDFAHENFGDFPHRRQLAAHEIPDPETVIDREALGRVLELGG